MGQARKYILSCDFVRPSGVTTVSGSSEYDLTIAFSGTSVFDATGATFSYSAITLSELSELTDAEYDQRAEDFLSYVSVNEYYFTSSGLTEILANSQYDDLSCFDPITTTTTSTSTTTTTAAPTTTTTSTSTTTTTAAPTTTTTTTTVAPITYNITWTPLGGSSSPDPINACAYACCQCWQINIFPALSGNDYIDIHVNNTITHKVCACTVGGPRVMSDTKFVGGTILPSNNSHNFVTQMTSAPTYCTPPLDTLVIGHRMSVGQSMYMEHSIYINMNAQDCYYAQSCAFYDVTTTGGGDSFGGIGTLEPTCNSFAVSCCCIS